MIFKVVKKNKRKECFNVLLKSFEDYPFFQILDNDYKKQNKFYHSIMRAWIKNSFKYGTVFACIENNKIVAVSVIKGPNDKEIGFFDLSIKSIKSIFICGFSLGKEFYIMNELSDLACKKVKGNKWHIVSIGVLPSYKGKGIASKMINDVICPYIISKGGELITLNTSTEGNCCFYKKNGFEEIEYETLLFNNKEIPNWSFKKILKK